MNLLSNLDNEEKFITNTPQETIKLGEKIAKQVKKGIICLIGQLGSGKTTFAQGLAQGYGIKERVNSPSFQLIKEYQGNTPFFHIDLYRLDSIQEIEDLGIQEYYLKQGVIVIEWAEKIFSLLPKERVEIYFSFLDDNQREIKIVKKGLGDEVVGN